MGGIDVKKSTLSEVDALKVARLFNFGAVETRSGSPKGIKQLMSISNNPGEPLMFVVNFEDNKGYVIMSATKNMPAILAYSEEGNFDESYFNTGMSIYIDEFKYDIKKVLNKDIDSLRIKYALSWSLFEQQNTEINASTRSAVGDKRRKEVMKWEGLGYECFPLSHLSAHIGSSEANNIINGLCNNTNTSYDCMSSAILLIGVGTVSKEVRLMQTAWDHHVAPYNVDAPNGKAGCWPIAIAQLMKYYHHPNTYKWNNISVNPNNNADFNYFIKDVRAKCNVIYLPSGTGTTASDAVYALNNYFQYNATSYSFTASESSYSIIKASLDNQNPVLMRGATSDGLGHAWVAHGYKERYYEIGIAYIPRSSNEYAYMHVKNDGVYDKYYNMNWGRGKNSDYVYTNSAFHAGDGNNYLNGRLYILVTKK